MINVVAHFSSGACRATTSNFVTSKDTTAPREDSLADLDQVKGWVHRISFISSSIGLSFMDHEVLKRSANRSVYPTNTITIRGAAYK